MPTMLHGSCALILALPCLIGGASVVAADAEPAIASEHAVPSALAPTVAAAAGVEAWSQLKRLRFTWTHVPTPIARSYDWDLKAGTVVVTAPAKPGEAAVGAAISVPCATLPAGASEADTKAHQGFINDSYWLLFTLHLKWDAATVTDLGTVDVPQVPDLGTRPAMAVQYPAAGGYTPGDRYVLYLGDDHLPVAWAFHKAAAAEPTLVTRWLDYRTVGGLRVPTRFTTPDGKDFITITDLSAE